MLRHIEEEDRLWQKKARRRERREAEKAEQNVERGSTAGESKGSMPAFAQSHQDMKDEDLDPLVKARKPKPGFY